MELCYPILSTHWGCHLSLVLLALTSPQYRGGSSQIAFLCIPLQAFLLEGWVSTRQSRQITTSDEIKFLDFLQPIIAMFELTGVEYFTGHIFKCIFLCEKSCTLIEMLLRSVLKATKNNNPVFVTRQHQVIMLNQRCPGLPVHIFIIGPQWVNDLSWSCTPLFYFWGLLALYASINWSPLVQPVVQCL